MTRILSGLRESFVSSLGGVTFKHVNALTIPADVFNPFLTVYYGGNMNPLSIRKLADDIANDFSLEFPLYVYDTFDGIIYPTSELLNELSKSDILENPRYIPLCRTDRAEIFAEFLKEKKRQKYIHIFKNLSNEEKLKLFYNMYNEYTQEYDDWIDYLYDRCAEKAIAWCKENRIPYKDDMRKQV